MTNREIPYTREALAEMIIKRLTEEKERMRLEFRSSGKINSCYIDNLLPDTIVRAIYDVFPDPEQMAAHKSLRENKRIAVQMDRYHPLLEEIIFAFQHPSVVKIVEDITGIEGMEPDENLYAGGLSLMTKGNFLNPHLDNSHDNEREKYRVLNLLYYVSPDWKLEFGGNLELWDKGVRDRPRTIISRFNRLVLMITNKSSYHSVSNVIADRSRCCVSNYYFSRKPAEDREYFHVTSFYGRPEEPFKNFLLKVDRRLRQLLRKVTGKRLFRTKHIYKK